MEISLALGGGGVRGVAHIGVMRALEKHGFEVKAVSGTSAGGLFGSVYAAGFSTEEIENVVSDFKQGRSFHRKPNDRPSLIGMSGIANLLSNLLGDMTFDELKIPFATTAVSLQSGKEIILCKGKVLDAVLATIAIPGVFPSQEIGGEVLMDGGVVDPVPVQVARWMRPDLPVVAVMLHKQVKAFEADQIPFPITIPGPINITERLEKLRPVQALKIFTRSTDITGIHLSELAMQIYKPEVLICPLVGHIGILQEINAKEMIQAGIEATEETMNEIKSQGNWRKQIRRKLKHRFISDLKPDYWEVIGE